jgi:AcrR family transcriptional regulator
MGLRERQRNSRRQRILDVALGLFVANGFDATKTEEIAEKAEMALGTIYNHFTSKGEILLTLAAIENEQLMEFGEHRTLAGNTTVCQAFTDLIGGYFAPDNVFLNKDLWRIAFALAFTDITSDGARRLRRSDRELTRQVINLAETLRHRQLIPDRIDPVILGTTLFNAVNMQFFDFARSEKMTEQELRKNIGTTLDAILRLAIPGLPE